MSRIDALYDAAQVGGNYIHANTPHGGLLPVSQDSLACAARRELINSGPFVMALVEVYRAAKADLDTTPFGLCPFCLNPHERTCAAIEKVEGLG